MSKFFQWLPMILQAVVAVEAVFKNSSGKTKQDIAIGVIQAGAQAVEQAPIPAVADIGSMVDQAVTVLNQAGVFTHAAAGN